MVRTPISEIKNTLKDYGKWVKANKPKHFSLFDYLHAITTQKNVEPDLFVGLFAFLWPEFRELDKKVILAEEFSQERYDAGAHMNTQSISEMFPNLDFNIQKTICEMIVEMWGAKLKLDFPNLNFIVECYEDEPEDLWCYFYQAKTT